MFLLCETQLKSCVVAVLDNIFKIFLRSVRPCSRQLCRTYCGFDIASVLDGVLVCTIETRNRCTVNVIDEILSLSKY